MRNWFRKKQQTLGYTSIPNAAPAAAEDPAAVPVGVSKRMMLAIAAGVMLIVVAGGTVLMLAETTTDGGRTTTSADAGLVTWDESCMKEVPGAGPCCDGHPLHDECHQVCDWLLLCDNGYVPELTDDTATVFPETSDYQPDNCFCRGDLENYHDGCFCRQVRDMIIKFSDGGVTGGGCDPCLPPPPTSLPTPLPNTHTVYKRGHDYCFYDRNTLDKHCWYPTRVWPVGDWVEGHYSSDTCGPKCTDLQPLVYDPNDPKQYCFHDHNNPDDKFCWTYDNKYLGPVGNWREWTGVDYDQCGPRCTDTYEDSPCIPADGTFSGISYTGHTKQSYPFETCWQLGDEDKYCWTKSWHHPTGLNIYGKWLSCAPNGDGWNPIDAHYVNPVTYPTRSCGPPCQEQHYYSHWKS